jgi:D-lactate dehydrogenase
MKIAFFEVTPQEQDFFAHALKGHELYFFKETINDALKSEAAYEIVSVFVHSRITDTMLEKLPHLKYLQTRSTGYDHIKCKALYKKDILVSNVAGYAGPPVGEFAFSLLLNAMRKTHVALIRTKNGDMHYHDLLGTELYQKRIGILGLGVIGERMVRIAAGFGMRISAFSRTKKPVVDELGIDFTTELEYLLPKCDVLMIALPLTPATKDLINSENASCIPKETIIVNIARAEIIEEKLYESLPNTICTDVLKNPAIAKRENILYTPHMAYYTKEALQRIREISLKNIEAFIEGKPLPNCLKFACEREYGK